MLIIYLCVECWQDDPENRPEIQHVKTRLTRMTKGTNIVNDNIVNNNQQQINQDNDSFGHSSTILIQKNFDEIVKNFEVDIYSLIY